jgi:hypothetical protein
MKENCGLWTGRCPWWMKHLVHQRRVTPDLLHTKLLPGFGCLSTRKQVTEALPPASAMDPPTISICMIFSINIDLPLAGQKGHHQVNLLLWLLWIMFQHFSKSITFIVSLGHQPSLHGSRNISLPMYMQADGRRKQFVNMVCPQLQVWMLTKVQGLRSSLELN